MKIAIFVGWLKTKGGQEKMLLEWLKHTKHEIDLYTWDYKPDKTFEEYKNYKITIIKNPFESMTEKFIFRGITFGLTALLFTKIPDGYDAILITTAGISELIAFRNNHKNLIFYVNTPLRAAVKEDIEWNLKHRYTGFFKQTFYKIAVAFYKILEKLAWRNAKYIMYNSKLVEQRALDKGIATKDKGEAVYLGIDIKERQNTQNYSDYFLYVARYGMAKKQIELIEAWKTFTAKYPQYRLILVGGHEANGKDNSYFDKVKLEASKLNTIEIKTNISNAELESLYSNCLAGLHIAYREDFGLVPLEVISYNKPLIAVKTGGFAELLDNYRGVVWVDDKEDDKVPENFAKQLEVFIQEQEKYINCSKDGYIYLKRLNMDWEKSIKRLDNKVTEFVNKNGK